MHGNGGLHDVNLNYKSIKLERLDRDDGMLEFVEWT